MSLKKNNSIYNNMNFVTNCGSPEKVVYRGVLQKNGTIELVKDHIENLYQSIQSYKDTVDINMMVERYMNGEIDILNQIQGSYVDVSSIPKDRAEILRIIRDAEYQFNRLPLNVKSKFNNSFEEWFSSYGSEKFAEKMDLIKKPDAIIDNPDVEVKE